MQITLKIYYFLILFPSEKAQHISLEVWEGLDWDSILSFWSEDGECLTDFLGVNVWQSLWQLMGGLWLWLWHWDHGEFANAEVGFWDANQLWNLHLDLLFVVLFFGLNKVWECLDFLLNNFGNLVDAQKVVEMGQSVDGLLLDLWDLLDALVFLDVWESLDRGIPRRGVEVGLGWAVEDRELQVFNVDRDADQFRLISLNWWLDLWAFDDWWLDLGALNNWWLDSWAIREQWQRSNWHIWANSWQSADEPGIGHGQEGEKGYEGAHFD
jgi:hypothetical protein